MISKHCLALLALGLMPATLPGQDSKDRVPQQKKAALEAWGKLAAGEALQQETTHLILMASKDQERKLNALGTQLEKFYDQASKLLFTGKDEPWAGKLTVYLLGSGEQYDAFLRRVANRRPEEIEAGSFSADDDRLYVVACPPRGKDDPALEIQAGMQIASLLLQRKAGKSTPLPFWLLSGFGRATWYRAAPGMAVTRERRAALTVVQKNRRNASDVWTGGLENAELTLMHAAVADFLAYGPGKDKFLALLEGFKPEENVERKTTEQALTAAGLKTETINPVFRRWLATVR